MKKHKNSTTFQELLGLEKPSRPTHNGLYHILFWGIMVFAEYLYLAGNRKSIPSPVNLNTVTLNSLPTINQLSENLSGNTRHNAEIQKFVQAGSCAKFNELQATSINVFKDSYWKSLSLADKLDFVIALINKLPPQSYLTNDDPKAMATDQDKRASKLARTALDKINFELAHNPLFFDPDLKAKESAFEQWAAKKYPQADQTPYDPMVVAQEFGDQFVKMFGLKYHIKFKIKKLEKHVSAESSVDKNDNVNRFLVEINEDYLKQKPTMRDFLDALRHEFKHEHHNDDLERINAGDPNLTIARKLNALVLEAVDSALRLKFGDYEHRFNQKNQDFSFRDANEYQAYAVADPAGYIPGIPYYSPIGNFDAAYMKIVSPRRAVHIIHPNIIAETNDSNQNTKSVQAAEKPNIASPNNAPRVQEAPRELNKPYAPPRAAQIDLGCKALKTACPPPP